MQKEKPLSLFGVGLGLGRLISISRQCCWEREPRSRGLYSSISGWGPCLGPHAEFEEIPDTLFEVLWTFIPTHEFLLEKEVCNLVLAQIGPVFLKKDHFSKVVLMWVKGGGEKHFLTVQSPKLFR